MTKFCEEEIEVLKSMVFDMRYVKDRKSIEFVKKVVAQSDGDGDKQLIAFFSGFLPGARKSGNLSLVQSYRWDLMAGHYNTPIHLAALQTLEDVALAGPHMAKPKVIPYAKVGTKEKETLTEAVKKLFLSMPAKHTNRADSRAARDGNDDDRAQHRARQEHLDRFLDLLQLHKLSVFQRPPLTPGYDLKTSTMKSLRNEI
jgi:hypothetical protein